jgi:dihydroorotase
MADLFDLILRGGTVVNQDGAAVRDVGVREGRIAAVGELGGARAPETLDCAGLHVLPGVIDTQVHFREPGMTHKEDLESGSRGAVMGGVTAVFEMPNTNPVTTDDGELADKVGRAIGRMHCDFAFFVGGTSENADNVAEFEQLPGCAGIKVFMGSSTGSLLVAGDEGLRAILRNIRRRASFHAEDEPRLNERKGERIEGDPRSHPVWRDPVAALRATTRLIAMARDTGKRVHVLHVSTAEEIDLLASHKDVATVEVTPHHLTLVAPECYERLGTRAQMNPPVRDARHRDAIWRGIHDGTVDILGSDHAPHTLEEKSKPYPASPSGMTGVQTLVPVMLDHVAAGRLSIERFVDLSSTGPARVFGIANKGRIASGYDGDFTIVDLKKRQTITNAWIESKAGWTPYDGVTVNGWPVATILRGTVVMRDGQLLARGQGQPVRFLEALPQGT